MLFLLIGASGSSCQLKTMSSTRQHFLVHKKNLSHLSIYGGKQLKLKLNMQNALQNSDTVII